MVVKADGLAAGKGVFVCSSAAEAEAAVRACLTDRRFGGAGSRVLIEERLSGAEVSLLALCDGEHVLALAPARDYKRIGDGDRGPNTGGMGCVSPRPSARRARSRSLVDQIHRPVIAELRRRGMTFQGCLYAGLMMTDDGPKVLEFNARFGDPETQVDRAPAGGRPARGAAGDRRGPIGRRRAAASPRACLTVVMAAAGYPEAPEQERRSAGSHAPPTIDGSRGLPRRHRAGAGRPCSVQADAC